MASAAIYDSIDKYVVQLVCLEPLHVGGASGDSSEVLIHPTDQIPFLQASGICGALRSCCVKICGQEKTNELFGTHEDDQESRIRFSDGKFENDESLKMELRPRVKIDPVSGTVSSGALKGAPNRESGHKFDMEHVGAGAKFSFEICLYGAAQEENEVVLQCLSSLNEREVQFGGQKSNGCGYVKVSKVLHRRYDMKNATDRRLWRDESGLVQIDLPQLDASKHQIAYEIQVHATTESELLVKGIAAEDFGKNAPKAENIQNANREYIIPGSSLKGSVRNRMEMIAAYMGLDEGIVADGFGKASDGAQDGVTGNLRFRDVIVRNGNDAGEMEFERTRIRIDKFTGGVINGALFSELNVAGELRKR
ncbi:MAG: RAMP superfamily CRISPR-associated protein [Lachnospiraceae bacterium]|nr:RAMP superfamily CRISPR-associated protein [Lachnospiraceae bacterium]